MNSLRSLYVFGGILFSALENAAKMAVSVFLLLRNLYILRNSVNVIVFSRIKYKRNLLVERSYYFCIRVPKYHHASPLSENCLAPLLRKSWLRFYV